MVVRAWSGGGRRLAVAAQEDRSLLRAGLDRRRAGNLLGVPGDDGEPPFNRWGRIEAPPELAGVYRLVDVENAEEWRNPPPSDAVRVWQRRPGVEEDHDDNWTVWLQRPDVPEWMSAVTISEWLPEGQEPDWSRP